MIEWIKISIFSYLCSEELEAKMYLLTIEVILNQRWRNAVDMDELFHQDDVREYCTEDLPR